MDKSVLRTGSGFPFPIQELKEWEATESKDIPGREEKLHSIVLTFEAEYRKAGGKPEDRKEIRRSYERCGKGRGVVVPKTATLSHASTIAISIPRKTRTV